MNVINFSKIHLLGTFYRNTFRKQDQNTKAKVIFFTIFSTFFLLLFFLNTPEFLKIIFDEVYLWGPLIGLICIPLFGIFCILAFPIDMAYSIAYLFSLIAFIWTIGLSIFYESSGFDYIYSFTVWTNPTLGSNQSLNFMVGVDSLSISFLLITAFITFLCICWENLSFPQTYNKYLNIKNLFKRDVLDNDVEKDSINFFFKAPKFDDNVKLWIICILLIEFFLFLAFTSLNFFFFYIAFESILIPMFIMMGIWGGKVKKVLASYYLFFYTFFYSLFFLVIMLVLFNEVGSLDYNDIYYYNFTRSQQLTMFIFFYITLASKVPVFPLHIWLPEAHVEAPTVGSVILASLLLKLGGYGFLRFGMNLFPLGFAYWLPLLQVLSGLSVVYASLTAIRQTDVKRIIAYSSVAHMNFAMLGLYSVNIIGLQGGFFLMISHSFVSAGLFFLIGSLYKRFNTRNVEYFGGFATFMPVFTIFFFIFMLANFGFPILSSFPAELLIMLGVFSSNKVIFFLLTTGVLLSIVYCMFLFNRVCFGVLNTKNIDTCYDLKFSEWAPLMILMICVFFFGIFPSVFFNFVNLDLIRISSLYDGITPVLESTANTSLNYSTFIEEPVHHEKIIINTVEEAIQWETNHPVEL